MSPFNTARKAMLHLLELFPASEDGQAPSPVRTLLLDIDSYLETLPALEITQRDEALISARAAVREQRMLLKIAELHEIIADERCKRDATVCTLQAKIGSLSLMANGTFGTPKPAIQPPMPVPPPPPDETLTGVQINKRYALTGRAKSERPNLTEPEDWFIAERSAALTQTQTLTWLTVQGYLVRKTAPTLA